MTTTVLPGTPCWYELTTTDTAAATAFYSDVLGWTIKDSGMPGMTYLLASAPDGGSVAGIWGGDGQVPPNWLSYFTCDDCDEASAAVAADGGRVLHEPADVPGTGRFSVCADPQGAVFGLLQPAPMDAPADHPPFDQEAVGHGNWHELMSADPVAGFDFYAGRFAWTKGEAMDMGEMGVYQLFALGGSDIGGVEGLMGAPSSVWLPYFGVEGVDATVARITAGGGVVQVGPMEVPGGAFIAAATDPQGAWFAVVGPR